MNLLKALEGFSRPETADGTSDGESSIPPSSSDAAKGAQNTDTEKERESFNAMQSVLERHEAIANRVKNRK